MGFISQETRRKMVESRKRNGNYKLSLESKNKISNSLKGNTNALGHELSNEMRSRMSNSRNKGLKEGKIRIWNKGKTIRAGKYISHYKHIPGTKKAMPSGQYSWINQKDKFHRVPKKTVIHHLDFNNKNNSSDNLAWITDSYHRRFHNEVSRKLGGNYY